MRLDPEEDRFGKAVEGSPGGFLAYLERLVGQGTTKASGHEATGCA